MHLYVKNFAKIVEADVDFNGITVIGGENNTGKSTVGKILYTVFHSMRNIDRKIKEDRYNTINRIIRKYEILSRVNCRVVRTGVVDDSISGLIECVEVAKNQGEDIAKSIYLYLSQEIIDNPIFPDAEGITSFESPDFSIFVDQLVETVELSNEEIRETLIRRNFEAEFHGQINQLGGPKKNNIARVIITFDDEEDNSLGKDENDKIEVTVSNNMIKVCTGDVKITTPTVYLDDPFLLNRLDKITGSYEDLNEASDHSTNLIQALIRSQLTNSVTEETVIRKKLHRVFERLEEAIGGDFVAEKKARGFIEKGLNKPLRFSNLSTGIKTFLIFEILLLNGEISEGSILILDEPEVHLHPAWQLIFAEVVVLLQEELNLRVFLTTHSPYFLRAIEVYSAKHEIADRCTFYMADFVDNEIILKDVTTNTDAIYKKLVEPFAKLDEVQYGDE
jgi:AAA15 family ATPase/GTPase